MTTPSRLLNKYRKDVIPVLRDKFGYATVMAVPRIAKVTLNVGTGKIVKDTKMLERIERDLAVISGQKASIRKAKKSIAGFKVRTGMDVGMLVTLRGRRMYDFIDRLISVALPRSRDFSGIDRKSVDERGNLSIGIREHTIFPEVTYESLKDIFGFQITVTTTARSREEGRELLRQMGFPLRT